MNTTHNRRVAGLRHWADGIPCHSAAVDLLVGFNGGRLAVGPWIRSGGSGQYWFDPVTAYEEMGYLSGGERRVLAVAMSLVSVDHPVDLGDVLTGIDPKAFVLVMQTLGQAYGLNVLTDEKED